jgi:hypothetical protein
MRYAVFAIAAVAIFTIFTTVFAASAHKNEVRVLPKWAWVLICLCVPIIGGLLYLGLGRPKASGPRGTRTVTLAPDDDPEFLRNLRERLNPQTDDSGDEGESNPKPGDA